MHGNLAGRLVMAAVRLLTTSSVRHIKHLCRAATVTWVRPGFVRRWWAAAVGKGWRRSSVGAGRGHHAASLTEQWLSLCSYSQQHQRSARWLHCRPLAVRYGTYTAHGWMDTLYDGPIMTLHDRHLFAQPAPHLYQNVLHHNNVTPFWTINLLRV